MICIKLDMTYSCGEPAALFGECDPYQGTIEGARAAWAFIVAQIDGTKRPTRHRPEGPDWWAIIEKYERELEGMK